MIAFWSWFILAAILLIIEMLSMTTLFLFLAIGSIVIGIITLYIPSMDLSFQLILAGFFALLSMILSYIILKIQKNSNVQKIPDTNSRMQKYIGTEITLSEDVKNGISKAKIGDTHWRILINEGKKNDTVTITGFKSTSFTASKIL